MTTNKPKTSVEYEEEVIAIQNAMRLILEGMKALREAIPDAQTFVFPEFEVEIQETTYPQIYRYDLEEYLEDTKKEGERVLEIERRNDDNTETEEFDPRDLGVSDHDFYDFKR